MTFQERYQYNPQTDLLGKGGFARVFKAKDVLLDRDVAIKVFSSGGSNQQYTVIEEIKKAIRLEHPNLLRYYDVAVLEHSTALGEKETIEIGVMELANAGDLKQFAKKNPGSPILFKLLQQVLSGLEYLHHKGIIHRDLKPQNILLVQEDGELTAKISDFGISKSLESGGQSSSMAIGTIEYMAPEQFNPAKYGINGKIATNVDLWSFGIMVHELLTNEPLFGARNANTTAEQIMSAILSNDVPKDIDKLPEPFRATVQQCLIKDAKERVKKAKKLIAMLEGKTPETTSNETIALPKQNYNYTEGETHAIRKQRIDDATTDILPQATKVDATKKLKNKGYWVVLITTIVALLTGMSWFVLSNKNKINKTAAQVTTINKNLTQQEIKQLYWDSLSKILPANVVTVLNEIDSNMVLVQGGNFTMGSKNGGTDALPKHIETVKSFKIARFEVTQAQWKAIMGNNPSHFTGDNLPVESISWINVIEFLKKINQLTGKSYRLPTEVEWEYAAKGGNSSHKYNYAGSNNINLVGWYESNSENKTHQVGQKQPNELGIYDMTGNVYEWCNDWFDTIHQNRVKRGGSWAFSRDFGGVSDRSYSPPDYGAYFDGIRLVQSL